MQAIYFFNYKIEKSSKDDLNVFLTYSLRKETFFYWTSRKKPNIF